MPMYSSRVFLEFESSTRARLRNHCSRVNVCESSPVGGFKYKRYVRYVSNDEHKCLPYPLPHKKIILNKLSNFSYAMTLYFIMGYYNIFLTDGATTLCTVNTSFGKYKYNSLPMGVCIAPDIFQEQMSALMDILEFVKFYLDNSLVITSGSF